MQHTHKEKMIHTKALALAAVLFLGVFISVSAESTEITLVEASGTCMDFTVTVHAANLTGCWDIKVDVPGRIREGAGQWKSTFFYNENAICEPESQVSADIIIESMEDVVEGTVKLRQGNTIIESPVVINQACPEPSAGVEGFWIPFAAFAVVLIFGWGLAWWWKRDSDSGKK